MTETATPGIWYHGSPHTHLLELKSGDAVVGSSPRGPRGKRGIYFTQSREYAELYGYNGRIYEVELITRNPMTIPRDNWPKELTAEFFCDNLFPRAEAAGHDCIIAAHLNELLLLDESCIRYRSKMAPAPDTRTPGFFCRGDYHPFDFGPHQVFMPNARRMLAKVYSATRTARSYELITHRPLYVPDLQPPHMLWPLVARATMEDCDCIVSETSGDVIALRGQTQAIMTSGG